MLRWPVISKDTPAPVGGRGVIHCDGSCPENPGDMRIGFHIELTDPDEKYFNIDYGYVLGEGTNNVAEYQALNASLREALKLGVTHVQVFSDALIVVQQVAGRWKISENHLRILCEESIGLKELFTSFKLTHVHREENTRADYLSKHPTEPVLPPKELEIDLSTRVRRKISRRHAALMQYWWATRKCQNEYRLQRIFGSTASFLGKIGRRENYEDITEADLMGPHYRDRAKAFTAAELEKEAKWEASRI